MKIRFFKYEGAGNDFIIIDNRTGNIDHCRPQMLAALCHRRFGIGADGVMFLQQATGYDFQMVYYNSDGQPSSMCGNGGRCIVAFAKALKIIDKETNFLAVDGPHYATISASADWVSLKMNDVSEINTNEGAYLLNTGSPHYVLETKNLRTLDVFTMGKEIRNSAPYKAQGINVNFIEPQGDYYLIRTYERGVENETYACGTGATAAAIAIAVKNNLNGMQNIQLKARGGLLNVRFERQPHAFTNIYLEGPATLVFTGEIELQSL